MSLIQYQQATYATQLRDQLELAGCQARVAALVSRAIGELIDHVTRVEDDLKREIKDKAFRASMRRSELSAAKREAFDRFIGATLIVIAAAVACGVVLIALSR